ncbi:hypothetical protein OVA03_15550 [Asticcacaulis sp. SL142]|uniref:hypothetical protein n=1 Tax=Asticcacaulis sp. SL142 TaxID=2995155 RepID=UPI00226CFABD|nr:hypothetical protein [Asticcacaulis sp. SL142]WAC48090.1 hypothetical protein OVA03_15550 [Asticcacaulis sp. SL142]
MAQTRFSDVMRRWLLEWDDEKTRRALVSTLAVLLGLLLGMVLQTIFKEVGDYLFPPPPLLDMVTPEERLELMSTIPSAAFVITLVSWAVGALFGAYVAVRVAKTGQYPGWIVGILLFAGDLMTIISTPHPMWFNLISVPLVAVSAFVGAWLGYVVLHQQYVRAQRRAAARQDAASQEIA